MEGATTSGRDALAQDYEAWVGGVRVREEIVAPWPARAFAATLDRDSGPYGMGARLPAGWHWLYFHDPVPASRLGPDGHEARGDFLPDVPLPGRMWAGGRLRFHGPLALGDRAKRTSTIERIVPKEGRSGPLVFVTVRHEIAGPEGLAVEEEQDIVYRGGSPEGGAAKSGARGAGAGGWERPEGAETVDRFVADEVTLFRFSALTFNGHRIHYDHPYATGAEGYPGLVVHGPLLALLLLDAGARLRGRPLRRFEYRALAPVFQGEIIELVASPSSSVPDEEAQLWAAHSQRGPAMEARFL